MQQTQAHVVVMIAVGNGDEASAIARRLVEDRLAACVQIMPIRSIYSWQGQICDDQEQLLLVKTRADVLDDLERTVRALHSYEVPEITVVPLVAGLQPYLTWIDGLLKRNT